MSDLENPPGSALGICLGFRLYFTVYLSSCHNTDTVNRQPELACLWLYHSAGLPSCLYHEEPGSSVLLCLEASGLIKKDIAWPAEENTGKKLRTLVLIAAGPSIHQLVFGGLHILALQHQVLSLAVHHQVHTLTVHHQVLTSHWQYTTRY